MGTGKTAPFHRWAFFSIDFPQKAVIFVQAGSYSIKGCHDPSPKKPPHDGGNSAGVF